MIGWIIGFCQYRGFLLDFIVWESRCKFPRSEEKLKACIDLSSERTYHA